MAAGGSVELIAGEKIRFLPGTRVMPGGYLHAYIDRTGQFCSGLFAQMSDDHENENPKDLDVDVAKHSERLFTIYPNPGRGLFTFDIASCLHGKDLTLEVLSSDGRLVARKLFRASELHQLNLAGHDKGMYILILRSAGNRTVERIILW